MDVLKKIQKPADYKSIIDAGKEYKDQDFPEGKLILGKKYNYLFMPAKDIFKGKEKVYDSFSCDDIIQGYNGDCYFLSAISSLAEFPGRVEKLFNVKETNKAGCYAVTLYICGNPTIIMVDQYFAIAGKPHDKVIKLAFSGTKSSELWVMILEKAWAKAYGNYNIVDGGDPRESLGALTGAPVDKHDHKNFKDDIYKLWEIIDEADKKNYVICTGGVKQKVEGLEAGHVYTLINTYEVKSRGEEVKLVQIRNPWGEGEWGGEWSDKDTVHWTPELNKQLNHSSKDDGTFFMKFEDFVSFYNYTCVARVRDDFVFTNKIFEDSYACAIFKVKKKIIGCASAYQMNNRVCSAYKGIEKGIQALSLEIFSIAGSSIKGLGIKTISNAIGYAHAPINLEPGVYIMQAKFTSAENPIPYISLSIYADQAVDIVKLDIKDIRSVTPSLVEQALSTVSSAYKLKKDASSKLPENLVKCDKGHKLEWSKKPRSGPYACAACKKKTEVGEGRWMCNSCAYEICPTCRPYKKPAEKIGGEKCVNGHDMFFERPDHDGIYLCDKCGKAYPAVVERWYCEGCDLDYCRTCVKAPPQFKDAKPNPPISTCMRSHPITYIVSMTPDGFYKCEFCNTYCNPLKGRWYCDMCNESICTTCIAEPEKSKPVKTKITACDKGHNLLLITDKSLLSSESKCKKCEGIIPGGEARWNCKECQYDVCGKCRPTTEKKTNIMCKNQHPLEYSKKPVGKNTFTRCDKCHKAFNVTLGRYCCQICSFDLCPTCEPKT